MARLARDTRLEARAARARLPISAKPYFRRIAATWIADRFAHAGRYREIRLDVADDSHDSEGLRGGMAYDAHKTAETLHYPLGYKPAVDGLRALAVLTVMFYHTGLPGFYWGWVGVDVFFVISGYLITSILLNEREQRGAICLFDFYKRRAMRLMPALFVLCSAFLLYACFVPQIFVQALTEAAIALAYVGNWTRAAGMGLPTYLAHTWSLAVEEQFYLVWPLILTAAMASRLNIRLVFLLLVAVICWRAALTLHGASGNWLHNGTDTRADGLLIGACLAFAVRNPAWALRIRSLGRYAVVPSAFVLVLVPVFALPNGSVMFLGGYTVVSLAAAIILLAAVDRSTVSRLLSNASLVWVGKRSYGLYLWHHPITIIAFVNFGLGDIEKTVVVMALSIPIAALSYAWIEQPILQRRYSSVTGMRGRSGMGHYVYSKTPSEGVIAN